MFPTITIIKKTNNGRQPNTQKNRQYNYKKKTNNGRQHHAQKKRQFNYKKRKTMVGNIIHRKTDNTIINKDKQWLALGCQPLFVFIYNCIVCFSVFDVANHCCNIIHRKTDNTIINKDKQWSAT
jgi:hypothetical protein